MTMTNDPARTTVEAPLPKKDPPSAISNHLRDELIRILQAGDLGQDGAFTVAVAFQIEKFTAAARDILMTESLAKNDLGSLMMMRKQHLGLGGGPYGYLGGGGILGGNDLSMSPLGSYPPIVNNENFGVQVVRQIVDAIRTMGESPTKLVEALAAARSKGLDDVVAVLEGKLGVSKADPMDESANGFADLAAPLGGSAVSS